MEERTTPATVAYNGVDNLTIDLDTANETITLTASGNGNYSFALNGANTFTITGGDDAGKLTGDGTNTLAITNALNLTSISITDSASGTSASFGTSTGSYVDNLDIDLDDANAGNVSVDQPTTFVAASLTVSSASSITVVAGAALESDDTLSLTATRGISVRANLTGGSGGVSLTANSAGTATGDFDGIFITNSIKVGTTNNGSISLDGNAGAGSTLANYGVYVDGGSSVDANGSGTVSITGVGGSASAALSQPQYGVVIEGSVLSNSGKITIDGTGGAGVGGTNNHGVDIDGDIRSSSGAVSITGTAGNGQAYGIVSPNDVTVSGNGITLTGTGTLGDIGLRSTLTLDTTIAGTVPAGADITINGSMDSRAGTGNLTFRAGTAGNISATDALGGTSRLGAISIISAHDVDMGAITAASLSQAAGTGTTTLGGAVNTNAAAGVSISTDVVAVNDTVTTATTAGVNLTAATNISVTADITGGSGDVSLTANSAGTATGNTDGVSVFNNAVINTTNNGSIFISGKGGSGNGNANTGIVVSGGSSISANGSGTVSITGTGGSGTGSGNYGIEMAGQISSGSGTISLTGTYGDLGTSRTNSNGISIFSSSKISSVSGSVNISATGAGTTNSHALFLDASVSVGSGQSVNITADSVWIFTNGGINATATGTVAFATRTAGTRIDLGGNDVLSGLLVLGLEDAELDRVTAGTISIGTSTSGSATVSKAVSIANNSNLQLTAAGISQTASLSVVGSTTLAVNAPGSDILLASAANDLAGAVSIGGTASNVRDFALRNTNAAAGTIANLGNATTTSLRDLAIVYNDAAYQVPTFTSVVTLRNISITAGGAITQAAGGIVQSAGATSASFDAGDNTITLTDNKNNFTGAVSLSNSGTNDVSITDINVLILGTSSVGRTLTATADKISGAGTLTAPTVDLNASSGISADLSAGTISADSTDGPVSLTNDLSTAVTVTSLTSNGNSTTNPIPVDLISFAQSGGGTVTFNNVSSAGSVNGRGVISLSNKAGGIIVASTGVTSSGTSTINLTTTGTGNNITVNGPINAGFNDAAVRFDASGSISGTGLITGSDSQLKAQTGINITNGNLSSGFSHIISPSGNITIVNQWTFSLPNAITATGDVSLTSNQNLELNNNITTSGNTITLTANTAVTMPANVVLDTTNGGLATTGAAITINGTVDSNSTAKNLVLNAGTAGKVLVTGAIGGTNPLDFLTLTNSGGATFRNAVSAATVAINDTADGQAVAFQGNLTVGTGMTVSGTINDKYNVSITGSVNSIAGSTVFNNSGDVTIGDNAADVTLFSGGVDVTRFPSPGRTGNTRSAGLIRTAGATAHLDRLFATSDTTIDTTNNGVSSAGANIKITDMSSMSNFALTLIGGESGTSTLAGDIPFRQDRIVVQSGSLALGDGVIPTTVTIDQNNTTIKVATGSLTVSSNTVVQANANNLTLQANAILISNGAAINSTGTVVLAPTTPSLNVFLGTATGTGLQINQTAIDSISAGFLQVGLSGDSGTVTVGATSVSDRLVIVANGGGGKVVVTGDLTSSVTTGVGIKIIGSGSTTVLSSDMITAGSAIEIVDAVQVDAASVTLDTTNGGRVPAGANITITGGSAGIFATKGASNNNLMVTAGAGNVVLGSLRGFGTGGGTGELVNDLTVDGATISLPTASAVNGFAFLGTNSPASSITVGESLSSGNGSGIIMSAADLSFGGNITAGASLTVTGAIALGGSVVLAGDGIFVNGSIDAAGNDLTLDGLSGIVGKAGAVNVTGAITDAARLSLIDSDGATFGGGTVTAQTLQLSSTNTGTVQFSDNLSVAGTFSAASGTYALSIIGGMNTIGGPVAFLNTGILTIGDGADTTTISSGVSRTIQSTKLQGTVNFGGATTLGNVSPTNNGGDLTLTADSLNLGYGGAPNAFGVVSITTAGATTFTSGALASTALTVNAGSIGQTGGTLAPTSGAIFTSTGTIALGGDNNFGGSVQFHGVNVTIRDINQLDLAPTSSNATGNLNLSSSGNIVQPGGAITVLGSTTLTSGQNIFINLGSNAFTGPVAFTAVNVSLSASNSPLTLAASTATGTLLLSSDTNPMSQTGILSVTGTTTLIGSDINLGLANAFTGDVGFTGANVTINDAAGALNIATGSIATGNLALSTTAANGDITDVGTLTVLGNASFTTPRDAILDNLNVTGTVSVNTGRNATLVDKTQGLVLGASTVGGNLNVTAASGVLTDIGTVSVSGNAVFSSTQQDAGIFLDQISVVGTIQLNTAGTAGNASVTSARPLYFDGSTVNGTLAVTTPGNIIQTGTIFTVTGTSSLSAAVIDLPSTSNNFQGPVNFTGSNVTINNAVGLRLAGANSVTGNLVLSSATGGISQAVGSSLGVNGASTLSAASGINLDAPNNLASVNASTTAGDVVLNDTGDLVLAGVNANTGLASIKAPGAVTQTGAITAGSLELIGGGSFTLANTGNNVANLAANTTGAVSYTDSNALTIGNTAGATTGITSAGAVTVSTLAGTLTLTATGDIVAGGDVNLTGASGISTAGDVTTTGDLVRYQSATTLTGVVAIKTAGGDAIFNSTLTGTTAGAEDLSITAGAGDVTFGGVVGATALGAIAINSAADVTASGAITAASFTQAAGTGLTTLGGAVTATTGNVSVINQVINLNGGINTTGGNGTVTLNATVGALSIAAAGDIVSGGAVGLTGLGGIATGGDVVTTGDTITYNNDVTLAGNVSVDNTLGGNNNGATITFGGSINADNAAANNRTLTVNSGNKGAMSLGTTIGNLQPLAGLTVSNAQSVTFNSDVNVSDGTGIVHFVDTTNAVTFNGNLIAGKLLTGTNSFDLFLLGSNNVMSGGPTVLNNTGIVQIGSQKSDISLFSGGLEVTLANPNSKVAGTIRTASNPITLQRTSLITDTVLDTTNNGASTTGAAITLADGVTFNGHTLETIGGTKGGTILTGSVTLDQGSLVVDSGNLSIGNGTTATTLTILGNQSLVVLTGTLFVNANSTIDAGANDLTLQANSMGIQSGTGSIVAGALTVAPVTLSRPIFVGGAATGQANSLQLDQTAMRAFATGLLTIGQDGDTGTVTVGTLDIDDALKIIANGGGAKVVVNGGGISSLYSGPNPGFEVVGSGSTTVISSNIVTSGTAVVIDDAVQVNAATVTIDTTNVGSSPAGADVTITGGVSGIFATKGASNNLVVVAGSGNVVLGSLRGFGNGGTGSLVNSLAVGGATITLPSANQLANSVELVAANISLGGDLTAGAITPSGMLTLRGTVTLTNSVALAGDGITISGGVTANHYSLTLDGNAGASVASGSVSVAGTMSNLAGLNVQDAAGATFAAVSAQTVQLASTNTGVLSFGGDTTVSGPFTASFGNYDLSVLGSVNRFGGYTSFLNDGILTLGDGDNDSTVISTSIVRETLVRMQGTVRLGVSGLSVLDEIGATSTGGKLDLRSGPIEVGFAVAGNPFGDLTFQAKGDFTATDGVFLSDNLTVSAKNIFQTDGIFSPSATSAFSATQTIDLSGDNIFGGPVTFNGQNVTINNTVVELELGGSSSVRGNLLLTSSEGINQVSGAIVVAGSTSLSTSSTRMSVSQIENMFKGPIDFNGSDVTIGATGNLSIAGGSADTLEVTVNSGILQDTGKVSVSGASTFNSTGLNNEQTAILLDDLFVGGLITANTSDGDVEIVNDGFTSIAGMVNGTYSARSRTGGISDGGQIYAQENLVLEAPGVSSLSGNISGTGGLVFNGTGTLTISGSQDYSGQTLVNAGTVILNGSMQNSAVLVRGGMFRGNGNIAGLASAGGIVRPGQSPGRFISNGELEIASGSTYQVEIIGLTPGTGYSQIVAPRVTLGGKLELDNGGQAFRPQITQLFTIVNNSGSNRVFGTFAGLPEGSFVNYNGRKLQISYSGGDGNDVVLIPVNQVPAPTGPVIAPVFSLVPGVIASGSGGLVKLVYPDRSIRSFKPFSDYDGLLSVNAVDRSGDGLSDSLVVAKVATGSVSTIMVIDAATGRQALRFNAMPTNYSFGIRVSAGITEIGGAPRSVIVTGSGPGSAPVVKVFDSLNGSMLKQFQAFSSTYKGGVDVAIGNPDKNGVSRLAVGALSTSVIRLFNLNNTNNPVSSFRAFAQPMSTFALRIGDVNGDGVNEIIAGVGAGVAPTVKIFTQSGVLLRQHQVFAPNYLGGLALGLSDLNSDGILDIVVGTANFSPISVKVIKFNGSVIYARPIPSTVGSLTLGTNLALGLGRINPIEID